MHGWKLSVCSLMYFRFLIDKSEAAKRLQSIAIRLNAKFSTSRWFAWHPDKTVWYKKLKNYLLMMSEQGNTLMKRDRRKEK